MAVSFGTDATAQTSSTATSLAITIPSSGISAGDPVFVMTWAATTTGSAYSTQTWTTSGTTPVQLTGGIAQMHYLGLGTYITAQAWAFTAAAGDIGTTLTLNASVTGNLGIGLATYPGASVTPDCISTVGTTGFGTEFAVPPVTTVSASDWVLYLAGNTSSSLTAQPGTARAAPSDARTWIGDSNGSIGGAGTPVGGTASNYTASLAVWAGFTIGINVPGAGPPVLQGASVSAAVPGQAIPGFIPEFPGILSFTAAGSMALAPLATSAACAERFSCTGSMALAPKAMSASGAEKFTCTGSLALAPKAFSAACAEKFTCTGSLHLAPLAIDGSANGLVTAAGSLHLAPKAMAASGAEAFHATGSAHLAPRAIAATAAEVLAAIGALALPPQAMSASGAERFTASGSLLLASPAMAAEGGGAAAGSVRLAPLAMSGAGKNVRQALRPGGAVAPRLLPNTELVCISWLKTIPGLTADVVATQTPADETQWQANGCITVQAIGGLTRTCRSPTRSCSWTSGPSTPARTSRRGSRPRRWPSRSGWPPTTGCGSAGSSPSRPGASGTSPPGS